MPATIAIVGRPNVGKSTLFNRLSRSRRALVDDQPGITRDRLYARVTHEGVTLNLVDTCGFDGQDGGPMAAGLQQQTLMALKEAARVVFLVDGRQGITPADEEMAALLRRSGKAVVLAVNKIDGPAHDHLGFEFYRLGFDPVFVISAAHGYGVGDLLDYLVEGLAAETDTPPQHPTVAVAVVGRPNVGKSSLINRILGFDRLLVSDLPGTTRDAVDTPFTYGGHDYLLIDTAGIRRKGRVTEKIEKFSVLKALKSLERCDVAVVLLDAAEGLSEQDAHICGYALEKGKGVVLGLNKWDRLRGDQRRRVLLREQMERQLQFVNFAPRLAMSALSGYNVHRLFDHIQEVWRQLTTRVSTADVNRAMQDMVARTPPRAGRRAIKFLYATQAGITPPTFVFFVNRPDLVHFSYERYLVNQLRAAFHLTQVPIKLKFRAR